MNTNIPIFYSTALFALFSGILVAIIGFVVLIKNKKIRINQIFFLFTITTDIWLFASYFMFISGNVNLAIFWDRIVYIGVIFVPFLSYWFSLAYTQLKNSKFLMFLSSFLSVFFLIMSRTNYFVSDLFIHQWGVHTYAQFFHHVFLAYFVIYIGLTYYNLWKYYKSTDSALVKQQSKYVFLAFLFLTGIGSIAYLPAYGISVPPIGYTAGILFSFTLAYAITRHRLMSIAAIMKRKDIQIGAFVILFMIFVFISYLFFLHFLYHQTPWYFLLFGLFLLVIFYPFYYLSTGLIKKIVKKDIIDLYCWNTEEQKLLDRAESPSKLACYLVAIIQRRTPLENVFFISYEHHTGSFVNVYPDTMTQRFALDEPWILAITERSKMLSFKQITTAKFQEEQKKDLLKQFTKHQAEYLLPLKIYGRLVGAIFFGQRTDQDKFTTANKKFFLENQEEMSLMLWNVLQLQHVVYDTLTKRNKEQNAN